MAAATKQSPIYWKGIVIRPSFTRTHRNYLIPARIQTKGESMPQRKQYYVYIMTNRWNTVLYVGVTNNIARRVAQHKSGKGGRFTRKYNINRLVYMESSDDILAAIRREKQLKAGSRENKIALIESVNPEWRDLSVE